MAGGSNILDPDLLLIGGYAGPADFEECRRLHRKYGTTYYFASRRFAPEIRRRVDALYGFVRVPDEWVDNPSSDSKSDIRAELCRYRAELLDGLSGTSPKSPVLRAFCDVVREVKIPTEEPLLFLDAMESDLTVARYETYEELRTYMRGSAASVGMMMCYVLEAGEGPAMLAAAQALGEAMQMTNFLRDVAEDAGRNRVYLPREDLDAFKVSYQEIFDGECTDRFRNLMRFEIERAQELYSIADQGIPLLPKSAQLSVQIARVLYSRILNRIEDLNFDVFSGRARTSKLEKLAVAGKILAQGLR
jgi:phytoene synthase